MLKDCCPSECLWSDCERFCAMLRKAAVPLDSKWPVIILYLRGIKENNAIDEAGKMRLQRLLLDILREREFSEQRYAEITRRIGDIIAEPYAERLQAMTREASELIRDVHAMFGRHSHSVTQVAEQMREGMERGEASCGLLAGLRETLESLAAQIDKDASEMLALSSKDSLTGLANRRAFEGFMEEAIRRWQGEGVPLSLIMIDIDHFKQLNDTYGHLVGDEALKALGKHMQKTADSLAGEHSSVLAARYGGEEFALALAGEISEKASLIADNLRRTIHRSSLELRHTRGDKRTSLRITVSVGVADMWSGRQGACPYTLVDAADKALYHAKHSGRNCTARFMPGMNEPFALIERD
jgi:diguanylate cyclase (GGDEF)-like protein